MAPAAPDSDGKSLRSQGLLPALGVGAAVYFTTGLISLSTLGLVGIGAGGGYVVGSWAADKFRELRCQKAMDRLHPQLKVALTQWKAFVAGRVPGREPTQEEAAALFQEFEQQQPSNAEQVRGFVQARGGTVGAPSMSA
mmetsp:Transcript_106003/g.330611  ORF Transcript_106003/g.330611 Transcript_106003/m.330611 type:complete len:139 (-) Transcript_106003:22-438(-)